MTTYTMISQDDIDAMGGPSLLGITGLMGSGKTTAADVLIGAGWHRVKFAAPLKAMIEALYASAGLSASEIARKIEGDLKEVPCDILNGKTPRHAMQTLGTEWGRELIDSDLWLSIAAARIVQLMALGHRVVVDDVRFENEGALIQSLGGLVLELRRGQRSSGHASESGVCANIIYDNSGSLDHLRGYMHHVFIDTRAD